MHAEAPAVADEDLLARPHQHRVGHLADVTAVVEVQRGYVNITPPIRSRTATPSRTD